MVPSDQPLILTLKGKQTDPDGRAWENASVHEAVCREVRRGAEKGREYSFQEEDGRACLYVSRQSVVMERGGGTRMVFDPSLPAAQCLYRTPYGTIPMEIRTRRIAVLFSSGGGCRARVLYTLRMEPDIRLDCEVTLSAG